LRKRLLYIFLMCVIGLAVNGQDTSSPEEQEYSGEDNEENISEFGALFTPTGDEFSSREAVSFPEDLDKSYKKLSDSYVTDHSEQPEDLSWLARFFKKLLKLFPDLDLSWIVGLMRILIYIFIGFLALMLIRYLLFRNFSWQLWKKEPRTVGQVEDDTIGESEEDIRRQIRTALDGGNYRLAVRFYYIYLLRRLDENGLIRYNPEKTNSEYVREISSPGYKKDFADLSRAYDYIWYGEVRLADDDYRSLIHRFDHVLQSIRS